jgi:hypothetical protein
LIEPGLSNNSFFHKKLLGDLNGLLCAIAPSRTTFRKVLVFHMGVSLPEDNKLKKENYIFVIFMNIPLVCASKDSLTLFDKPVCLLHPGRHPRQTGACPGMPGAGSCLSHL